MSRPSKPKLAAAAAPKTALQAPAPVAAAPDPAAEVLQPAPETTGAVSAPASAAAEEPAAPVATPTPVPDEDHSQVRGPEGYAVVVTGPAKGRWRAGRKFGPEPVSILAQELTEAELRAMDEDPELTLKMVEIEA